MGDLFSLNTPSEPGSPCCLVEEFARRGRGDNNSMWNTTKKIVTNDKAIEQFSVTTDGRIKVAVNISENGDEIGDTSLTYSIDAAKYHVERMQKAIEMAELAVKQKDSANG